MEVAPASHAYHLGPLSGHTPSTKTPRCFVCGITSTPMWRHDGQGTRYCNACGIRVKRGSRSGTTRPRKRRALDTRVRLARELLTLRARQMEREMMPSVTTGGTWHNLEEEEQMRAAIELLMLWI